MSIAIEVIDQMIRDTAQGAADMIDRAPCRDILGALHPQSARAGAEMGIQVRLAILRDVRDAVMTAEMKAMESAA